MMDDSCYMCKVRVGMTKIMAIIDDLPEFNVPLLDDAIVAVFNAADDCHSMFRDYCDEPPAPSSPDAGAPEAEG